MIRFRLYDTNNLSCLYESPCFEASYTRTLDKTGPWKISVPLDTALYDLLAVGLYVRLYDGKRYLMGGKLQTKTIKNDVDPVIEVEGKEEIDLLYDAGANTFFYPDNQNFLLQIFTLLQGAGWRLGEYRNIDRTRLITIDLRGDTQLLTQLQKLIKQDPKLRYRYGGVDYAGQMLLDISYFQDISVKSILMPQPGEQQNDMVIAENSETDDYTLPIYTARGLGGRYKSGDGVTTAENVLDSDTAADADTTLYFDSQYPVYEEIVTGACIIIPTAVGPIGGRQYSTHKQAADTAMVGDLSGAGTNNSWGQWIFKPPPGLLTEVSFWTGAVTNEAALKTLVFAWELCDVVEGATPYIPGTLRASGIIPNANWTANARCRVVFDTPIMITYDKRTMFRCGFTTQPTTNSVIRVKALTSSNTARTVRLDRSTARSSGYLNNNYQPRFEAITTGTVTPVGRRTTLTNSRIIPTPNGTNDYSTTVEVAEAALALYKWVVDQIKLSNQSATDRPITLSGFNYDLQPGDQIEVRPQIQFPDQIRMISDTRIIGGITRSYSDQETKSTIEFVKLATDEPDETKVKQYDLAQKLYDQANGAFVPNPKEWSLTEVTQAISFRAPDTTLVDGTPAITITFTLPATPLGKFEAQIVGTPYLVHGSNASIPIDVELVSKPPAALIIKAAIRDIGWDVYTTATAYTHLAWR